MKYGIDSLSIFNSEFVEGENIPFAFLPKAGAAKGGFYDAKKDRSKSL
jgi:hypothetical protein